MVSRADIVQSWLCYGMVFVIGFTVKQDVVNVTLGTSVVPLPCINNWIIMMSRFDGSLDFNRPWVDYKKGFGDIRTSEFWIGNENIHLLTNQFGSSYRLRVEVGWCRSFSDVANIFTVFEQTCLRYIFTTFMACSCNMYKVLITTALLLPHFLHLELVLVSNFLHLLEAWEHEKRCVLSRRVHLISSAWA